MGEEAARQAAAGLKAGGAVALMSFGFAGALDSSLRPGDLVLPETVHAGYPMSVDLGWRSRLRQMLPASLNVSGGALARKQTGAELGKREAPACPRYRSSRSGYGKWRGGGSCR